MPNFLWFSWGKDKRPQPFKLIEQIPSPDFIQILEEYKNFRIKNKEKLALVLPGGGSLGRRQFFFVYWLYKIGVLKYVDMICGTSVGGLNTLLIAKYKDNLEEAANIWNNILLNSDIYSGMLQFKNLGDWLGMASQIFKDNKGNCILNKDGLKKLVVKHFDGIKLGDLKTEIVLTTTDIINGEMVVINSKENPGFPADKMALLTSAIPIIFEAEDFEFKSLKRLGVDGGVGRNNPVELAIKYGATKIILVGTSPNTIPQKILTHNIGDIAGRLETVIMHIFEEFAWDEIEDYKLLHKLNPDIYPSIEILDWYPSEDDMKIENEVNALDFTAITTAQKGYDAAVNFITPEKLRNFLLE